MGNLKCKPRAEDRGEGAPRDVCGSIDDPLSKITIVVFYKKEREARHMFGG